MNLELRVEGKLYQIKNDSGCPGCETCQMGERYIGKWTFDLTVVGPSGRSKDYEDPRGQPVFDTEEEARAALMASAEFVGQTIMRISNTVDKAVETGDISSIIKLIKSNMPSHEEIIH